MDLSRGQGPLETPGPTTGRANTHQDGNWYDSVCTDLSCFTLGCCCGCRALRCRGPWVWKNATAAVAMGEVRVARGNCVSKSVGIMRT